MEENHENALQQITLDFGGSSNESGASENQKEMSHGNFSMSSSCRPKQASVGMAGHNVYPHVLLSDLETPIPSEARCLRPPNKLVSSKILTASEHQLPSEKLTECCNHEAPGFQSKPHRSASRQKAVIADCAMSLNFKSTGFLQRRRLRIDERIVALKEFLQHSKEGGKAAALDDNIDYIKYLKFQIKNLSQSRLGGESSCTPFIFLEGYGHYLLDDQMPNEPLEEMIGKLLEVNPFASTQLLESRGLFMMPMALAEEVDSHA